MSWKFLGSETTLEHYSFVTPGKYFMNIIYLFKKKENKWLPRHLKLTSYILVFNLNLYNKGAHIISMHNPS